MKINEIQKTNFKAVRYTPNSKIYTSRFLTDLDKKLLQEGEQKLQNTRFWDLEVTGAGLRIAAKHTKDAFIDEFSAQYPKSPKLTIDSLYDGHADSCKTGEKCEFDLEYKTTGYAMLAYEDFITLPLVKKAITIMEKLEEQACKNSINIDSSIARRKSIFYRFLDSL